MYFTTLVKKTETLDGFYTKELLVARIIFGVTFGINIYTSF